jgi:hypothetical protein
MKNGCVSGVQDASSDRDGLGYNNSQGPTSRQGRTSHPSHLRSQKSIDRRQRRRQCTCHQVDRLQGESGEKLDNSRINWSENSEDTSLFK